MTSPVEALELQETMTQVPSKRKVNVPEIGFTTQVWKERDTYVGYAPELDISSCGDSLAEARTRLREAVTLFLEECSQKGILETILSEAGFEKHGRSYRPHRILVRAKVRLALPLAS